MFKVVSWPCSQPSSEGIRQVTEWSGFDSWYGRRISCALFYTCVWIMCWEVGVCVFQFTLLLALSASYNVTDRKKRWNGCGHILFLVVCAFSLCSAFNSFENAIYFFKYNGIVDAGLLACRSSAVWGCDYVTSSSLTKPTWFKILLVIT